MELFFPSMIPLESSVDDDFEPLTSGFSALLYACDLSKAALAPSSGIDTVVDALPEIQGALSWLERVTRTLQRRSDRLSACVRGHENNALPVSRLPEEVLRLVFEYDAETGHTWRRRLGAVCRRWRVIIYDHSILWAKDLFAMTSDMEKALEAAPFTKNSILLSLVFPCPFKAHFDDTDNVSTRLIPRARKLCLPIGYKSDLDDLMRCILSSKLLPHLATLILEYESDEALSKTCMPHRIIANHPQLRILRLRNLYMQPPMQGVLVTLDIDFEQNVGDGESEPWATEQPYLDALLEALSRNPALETLRLHYAFLLKPSVITSPRVLLPRLNMLDLSHAALFTIELLDRLRFPTLENLSIAWRYNDQIDDSVRVYGSILDAWTEPLPLTTSGSLQMLLNYSACWDMSKWHDRYALALEETNRRLDGRLKLRSSKVTNTEGIKRYRNGPYMITREVEAL